MDKLDRCPDHGRDEPGWEWPCPVAVEGDPPEKETCLHFAAMLERNMAEVEAGHYFTLVPDDVPVRERQWQEYRDHKPYGPPQPGPFREEDAE